MNSEAEEKRIRKLFSKMRDLDAERAPSFERNWRAAQSQVGRHVAFRYNTKFAFAALFMAVIGGALIAYRLQRTAAFRDPKTRIAGLEDNHQTSDSKTDLVQPNVALRQAPVLLPPALPKSQDQRRVVLARDTRRTSGSRGSGSGGNKRAADNPHLKAPGDSPISNWRSPTDFLLKTLDARLLRSVPKINDSIVRLDTSPLN